MCAIRRFRTVPPQTTQSPAASAPACQPLIVLSASFAAGICLDRYGPSAVSPTRAIAWWIGGLLALAVWCILANCGVPGRMKRGASLVLCVGIAAAGAGWHHAAWNLFGDDEVGRYARAHAEPTCIEAVALETPRRLAPIPATPYRAIPVGERSLVRIELTGIRRGREWRPASGEARLQVGGQLLGVHAGDRLIVFAQIAAPTPPRNPGEFDYAAHARADRRLAEFRCGFPECVQVVRPGAWHQPRRWLDRIQSHGAQILERQLNPPNAPVAAALVLARAGIFFLRAAVRDASRLSAPRSDTADDRLRPFHQLQKLGE